MRQSRDSIRRETAEIISSSERNYLTRERNAEEFDSELDVLAVESHSRSEANFTLPYHSLRTPAIDRYIQVQQEQYPQYARTKRAA